MATRYRFGESDYPHFITYTVVQWIDALSRPVYKNIVVDSLRFCIEQKGLRLHAWVIMSNHVHLIASASGAIPLQDILRDHKKFTSRQLIAAIEQHPQESRKRWLLYLLAAAGKANPNNKDYQFWQQDSHPIQLTTREMAAQKLRYLHDNPVRAGIVFEAAQYVYSSAVDYCSVQPGLLPLQLLD